MKFITLHDVYGVHRKKYLPGRPLDVRHDAITTLRGYDDDEIVRCVVGVNGVHYHVSETRQEILDMIDRIERGFSD